MTTGTQLRADGIADVLAADVSVTRGYADLIRFVVDDFLVEFTAEDIRAVIEDAWPDARPHHPNLLGATFRELALAGRIRPVGWTEATRPESRGRALRIWQATTPPARSTAPHGAAGVEGAGGGAALPRPATSRTSPGGAS